eukprot:TRINITY_DN31286_c0_g1_i1.p1 TRINITY_DN31286_c0_g1~~TRINITY_DN31286_c0_g1_i1.p1  ORF type:complete len:383 (-),score=67.94 TRINITY_DN31286_c0_g1_i1:100-1248(-)
MGELGAGPPWSPIRLFGPDREPGYSPANLSQGALSPERQHSRPDSMAGFRRLPERPQSMDCAWDIGSPERQRTARSPREDELPPSPDRQSPFVARLSKAQDHLLSWLGLGTASSSASQASSVESGRRLRAETVPSHGFQHLLNLPPLPLQAQAGKAQDDHRSRATTWSHAPDAEATDAAQPWWQRPLARRICLGLVVSALLGVALYPKEPHWEVLNLQIEHMDIPAFDSWSGIVHSLSGNSSAISMALLTTVQASNPNLIGATALPGTFNIEYDKVTIGKAATVEQAIGPLSSVVMKVRVMVDDVPGKLGIAMLHAMEFDNEQLPILVKGSVIAKVWDFKVVTKIMCDLHCDVRDLPAKTKFTKKVCTYTYDLPKDKKPTSE